MKHYITMRIDEGLLERLDAQAKSEGISRTALIERLCTQGLERSHTVYTHQIKPPPAPPAELTPFRSVKDIAKSSWGKSDKLIPRR